MLILGPLPVPLPDGHENGDWGWIGIHPDLNPCPLDVHSLPGHPGYTCPELLADRYGFGMYHKNLRPWWLGAESHPAEPCTWALASELPARHVLDPWFDPAAYGIPEAYAAARAHRFGR